MNKLVIHDDVTIGINKKDRKHYTQNGTYPEWIKDYAYGMGIVMGEKYEDDDQFYDIELEDGNRVWILEKHLEFFYRKKERMYRDGEQVAIHGEVIGFDWEDRDRFLVQLKSGSQIWITTKDVIEDEY